MITFDPSMAVGRLVSEWPGGARVLDRLGIDYCCGGRVPLARACAARGLDCAEVLKELEACEARAAEAETGDWLPGTSSGLADVIVATHHAYLRRELPRLSALSAKVAEAHGGRHPELCEVRDVVGALKRDLETHMLKEEWVLFPMIRRQEEAIAAGEAPLGGIAEVVRAMEHEHEGAGAAVARLRALTNGYEPPGDACGSYRSLLSRLAELEVDLHHHIHKENNILFPEAIEADVESVDDGAHRIAG
jgi:regulator of cell morphogenesis and NO signaling